MKECLKLSISKSDPKSSIGGFIGSLYREDGVTIVKELWRLSKKHLVDDLGYYAKWYNENILNEKSETEPGDDSSKEDDSEKN